MSIYNRPYMRSSYSGSRFSALKWVIVTLVVAFLLQMVLEQWLGWRGTRLYVALSTGSILHGLIYTPLTYGLLHSWDNGLPWHLLMNCLGLFLLGRVVQDRLGSVRFLEIFTLGVVVGGLAWLGLQFILGSFAAHLVGASAGVFAIVAAACLLLYDEDILIFPFPFGIKGRYLLYITGGIQIFFLLFQEIPTGSALGYSAHVGGMLMGLAYVRYLLNRPPLSAGLSRRMPTEVRRPAWTKRKVALKARGAGKFSINYSGVGDSSLRQEVDRILDKINSQGFGALTDEEKKVLDRAKDVLR